MPPLKIPPTPIPAMARPTMRAVLEGATAQIRDPTSKMIIAPRKISLICQRSQSDCVALLGTVDDLH